jgi:hypothetical protein
MDGESLEVRKVGELEDGVGIREEKTHGLRNVPRSDEHEASIRNVQVEG